MLRKYSLLAVLCSIAPYAFAASSTGPGACDVYNTLQVGQSLSLLTNQISDPHVPTRQVGHVYLWDAPSGYKYMLTFLNNGQPVGFSATSPTRIAFYPASKAPDYDGYYPGPYGTPSPNEKKLVYLSQTKNISLVQAQALLGTYGNVIGNVYQYKWPDGKLLTVDTDLNNRIHGFNVSAYCGPVVPIKYIF